MTSTNINAVVQYHLGPRTVTGPNGLVLDFTKSPLSKSVHDLAKLNADLRIYFPITYTYDHDDRYEVSLSHVEPNVVARIPDLQLRNVCENLSQQTFRFTLRNDAKALITGREIRAWVIKVGLWDSEPLIGAALLALSMFVQGSEEQGARVILACKETVADDLLRYGVASFMAEDEALNGFLRWTASSAVSADAQHRGAQGYILRTAGGIVRRYLRKTQNPGVLLTALASLERDMTDAGDGASAIGAVVGIVLGGLLRYTEDLDAEAKGSLRLAHNAVDLVLAGIAEMPGGSLARELLRIGLNFLFDELSEAANHEEERRSARTFIANCISIPIAQRAAYAAAPTKEEMVADIFFRWFQIAMQCNGFSG